MKIAIAGKGGVGKSTIAAMLINSFAAAGREVIAVDADPDTNLAATLGFSDPETITPVSELEELILERTGAKKGDTGSYFRLNPDVSDIPDDYCRREGNIRLLVMGTVTAAGAGCICPENAFLKQLMTHLVLVRNEVLVMDMVAGIEHMGRATAGAVDIILGVVEPNPRSIEVAKRLRRMAGELGIRRIKFVGNKVRSTDDELLITKLFGKEDIIGFIPYDETIIAAAVAYKPPPIREEILQIEKALQVEND